MGTITKIRTQPTLLQRVYRHEAGFACLLILALFGFMALAELFCTLTGAGSTQANDFFDALYRSFLRARWQFIEAIQKVLP